VTHAVSGASLFGTVITNGAVVNDAMKYN